MQNGWNAGMALFVKSHRRVLLKAVVPYCSVWSAKLRKAGTCILGPRSKRPHVENSDFGPVEGYDYGCHPAGHGTDLVNCQYLS